MDGFSPGTYVLWLDLPTPLTVTVGRLGLQTFQPGLLAYVGSARGPGGLQARIGRHLRANKKPHWHIDALTMRVPVVAVWLVCDPQPRECLWAGLLRDLPGTGMPVRGFGASDCDCPTHLVSVAPIQLTAAYRALGQPDCLSADARFSFSA